MKHLLISTFAAAVILLFGGVNEVNADPLTYSAEGDSVTIVDCKETASGALVIPSSYEGKPITSIGREAFRSCSSLTSVTIPDSVISIGDYAFYSCSGLTGITIPDSVTNIGKGAFKGCGGLTNVTIPGSVTTIGEQPFSRCESLTSINVANVNKFYFSVKGVLFDKNKTLLIQFPAGKSGHYTIPNSVQSIGFAAFYGCKNLAGIKVPKSNIKYSSEDGVLFDKNKTLLISYPAAKNGYYTIPDTVINIEYGAFYSTSLTSVTIPDSVTSIGAAAFYDSSSLTNVTIGESVKSVGNYAFSDCISLTSVTIPDSVVRIEIGTFERCTSLTSVTIPDSVTIIGSFAFRGCSSLTSVTIPDSVDFISNGAFEGCTSLKIITFEGDAPATYYDNAFNGVSENAQVNVKPGATGFGESIAGLTVVIVTTPEVLTITETPSVVLSQRLKLEVWVTGAAPFQYQWNKDGRPIPGAVSNVFVIESAKPSDAGVYSVLVINEYGATVSDEVEVSVIPPKISLEYRINVKGKFELKAIGPSGSRVTFQHSGNFKIWTDYLTLPLNEGSTTFSFSIPSNEEGQQFYRLKLVE